MTVSNANLISIMKRLSATLTKTSPTHSKDKANKDTILFLLAEIKGALDINDFGLAKTMTEVAIKVTEEM